MQPRARSEADRTEGFRRCRARRRGSPPGCGRAGASFISTWATCDFTVASPTISSAAISAFDMPRAISAQHLALALGEGVEACRIGRCSGGRCDELGDQPAGDGGSEQGVAGRDDAHGVQQLVAAGVLQQEAAGAGAQRVVDVVVEVERGEHEHPDRVGDVGPARRRVASIPSRTGMRMSISTTSGRRRCDDARSRRGHRRPHRPPRCRVACRGSSGSRRGRRVDRRRRSPGSRVRVDADRLRLESYMSAG